MHVPLRISNDDTGLFEHVLQCKPDVRSYPSAVTLTRAADPKIQVEYQFVVAKVFRDDVAAGLSCACRLLKIVVSLIHFDSAFNKLLGA